MKNPWRRYWDKIKARRDSWKPVLEAETKKWSAMPYSQIVAKLPDRNECYEVEVGCKRYQVEAALLQNTERYIHVAVSVDDGSLPASFRPAGSSFICDKNTSDRSN
jgi:hypothetical protein